MFTPRMLWRGTATDKEATNKALSILLKCMTDWNVYLMTRQCLPPLKEAGVRCMPRLPGLYDSGARYIKEDYDALHPEDWLDVLEVLAQGGGDCEDLACYRAAELQVQGEKACAVFHRKTLSGNRTLVHILVQRADGSLEDPSRRLGM